jgi:hypothetical protein
MPNICMCTCVFYMCLTNCVVFCRLCIPLVLDAVLLVVHVGAPLVYFPFAFANNKISKNHPGVLDVRGRSDFSRFDPRPERPRFSNFGPPAERRPFCETPPAVGL